MFNCSDDISELMKAIGDMQKEFGVTIGMSTETPKWEYANLPQILETIQERASKFGLVLTQDEIWHEGKKLLTTMVYHTPSKQYKMGLSELTPNPNITNPDQAWGGSSTYHRRYCAMMAFGLFQWGDATDTDGVALEEAKATHKPKTYASNNKVITDKQYGFLMSELKKLPNPRERHDEILHTYKISNPREIKMDDFNAILASLK